MGACCVIYEPACPYARSARLIDDVLADIQGFITSGYGHLSNAAYLFVQFHDARQAQRWLGRLAPAITTARPWPIAPGGGKVKPSVTVNIAFTADGLAAFGLPAQVLCTFPPEFLEGLRALSARNPWHTEAAILSNGILTDGNRPSMLSYRYARRMQC